MGTKKQETKKLLKTIPTETCIPMGQFPTVYSDKRVYIRVRDEAAGPYLAIEGVNDDLQDGDKATEFYLQSIKEIDEFAVTCKRILKKAQEVEKSGR